VSAAAFERAFGEAARCNRCAASTPDYRVIATFLHDTVAVRAYCQGCYEAAIEGEYHARGDGLILDYGGFAERFGAAGPPPPPCTPVDRALRALIREPGLRSLAPPSEALARRARSTPYRFKVELVIEGGAQGAELALMPDGRIVALVGEPLACERLRALLR
jgi:hypothetical protein